MAFRRQFLIVLLAGCAVATGWAGETRTPDPVTAGVEVVVIPRDWRSRAPFAARFQAERAADELVIDLAATSFATTPLVVDTGLAERRFLSPDLSSFAPELVREAFAPVSRTAVASDLFVVQAPSPADQVRLRTELLTMGAPIRGYVADYAYLVRLSPEQQRDLSRSAAVFWLGLMQPAWRVAPKLDYIIEADPEHPLQLTALFEPDAFASPAALRQALAGAGLGVDEVADRDRGFKVRLRATAIDARRLAAMPGCLWVERFADYRLDNNVARTSSDTATGRGAAAGPVMDVEDVWARGLRGEGQIAAASDTGLSTGDLATLHRDFGRQGSPTNPMRVIAAYALGRPTWDDDQTISGAGHGTHVAGSLVGNGVRSGADPANDDFPASSYAGSAPKAGFVFQSILDGGGGLGGIPADLNTLFQTPYDDGARVHSNSWSSPVNGQYTADSQEVDEFVWDNPDMVITYTAGNAGEDGRHRSAFCNPTADPIDGVIDDDSIGAPGTAKNNITVGASENYRPGFTFEAPEGDCTSSDGIEQKTWGWFDDCELSTAPIFADLMADDASGLGAFSSRGPTDDGRFKPDLVASGIAVISTRTDQNQAYQQWGTCDVPPALRPYYVTLGGTSMANPLTAGAAVLARQYYEDGWHGEGNAHTNLFPLPADAFNPSAALVKATLVNGAWDIAPGQYGGGATQEIPPNWDAGNDLPNNAEGYGRVDLEAALFPGSGFGRDAGRDMEVHDVSPGLATGGSDVYMIPLAASADPLIVTLVWSDPYAAVGAGSQLVNDLDLTVTSPSSTVYYPNGVDRTVGAADRTNNVEQVKVTSPAAGSWTVRVDGFSVPGNAEPGTTVQPYALVVSGVFTSPCSAPAPPSGLTATPDGTNRIDLAWSPIASDSYSVHRATTPGGPYDRIATGVTGTAYSDATVSGAVTYYYVVTAVNDPNCESAFSGEASATAFGDCTVAPTFSGLASVGAAATGGSCVLRLDWPAASSACDGPPVYNVYRSTSPGFTPGPGNMLQACVTDTFYDDGSAASGTEYSYVVRAEDATLGNGGACQDGNEDLGTLEVAGDVGSDVVSVLFADDFDGSQTPGDLWHFVPANDPLLANPYTSGSCAPSPTGSGPDFYVSDWYRPETGFCSGNAAASNDAVNPPSTSYSEVNNGYLILGLPSSDTSYADGGILLPTGVTSITLTFDHDYDFESSSQDWDGGRVRLSDCPATGCAVDPLLPSSFDDLVPAGGYPGTVTTSSFFCAPWPGVDAYVGDSGGCVGATFDLTAYAGQRVWIAWNHGGDNDPQTDSGWTIDNVRLEAKTPNPCALPPGPVQFLTATAIDGENRIEWLNPPGGAYGSTMIRYRTDTFPADPADGTLLVDQAGTPGAHDATTHSGLTNGTTYYYSAFVDNGAGEFSARKTVSARPFDTSGDVRWAYSTGASAMTGQGIGSVYAVSNDRVLHAADVATGTWPAGWTPMELNGGVAQAPLIVPIALGGATKVAFLGSQDGRAYAVDADSGGQLWASPDLGAPLTAAPAGIFTAFGGAHDLLLVGTRNPAGNGTFRGLNLADGTVAWTFDNGVAQGGTGLGIGVITSRAEVDVANRRVYFASRRRAGGSPDTVWCLDFTDSTSTLLWSRDVGEIDGSPVLENGRVYVGTNAGEVHALDAATGADLWAAPFATGDGPVKGGIQSWSGTDFVLSTTNTVWSISDDGAVASLNWSVSSIAGPSMPAVGSSTVIWVGSADGKLHSLDPAGDPFEPALTLGAGTARVGSPAISMDAGFVASDEGRLYAFNGHGVTPPVFLKAFAPDTIASGGVSTLTFTIDNTAIATATTALAFTDNLPAGVVVAATPNASTTCTGGTITAAAGTGVISYSGGTVAAGATCTVQADVTSSSPGVHVNTSGDLTSSAGNSGTATDTLTVIGPPLFSKAFSPDTIATGGISTLTFTIDSSANAAAVTALDFTDNLPAGVVVAATPNASATCIGGTITAAAATGTISYTGGTVAAGATCTVQADVTSSTAGAHVNVTDDLTSSAGSSGTATDTLTVNPLPGFAKAFAPDTIFSGQVSTLTFTIDNSGSTIAASALDFTDNLPAAVTVAATPNASTTCTGGVVTAVAASGTISYTGGTVAAGATCTVQADVTSSTAGAHVNVTGDLTSSAGNSGTATDTLTVVPPNDFGDAPDTYKTTLFAGGARHAAVGPTLGTLRDTEADAAAPLNGTGDDVTADADEDGVTIPVLKQGLPATITVVASVAARLDGFIDFNDDGDFDDSGEKVFDDVALAAGSNDLDVTPPGDATVGSTFARFRLSTTGGLGFDGQATDGEVEDYAVTVDLSRPLYHPLNQCVVLHTIRAADKFDPNEVRGFEVRGETKDLSAQGGNASGCGVPTTAEAVALNFKVQGAAGNGQLMVFEAGRTQAPSVLNFSTSHSPFNNAVIVPLTEPAIPRGVDDLVAPEFSVKATAGVHVVAHVVGYFAKPGAGSPAVSDDEESARSPLDELLSAAEVERFLGGEDPSTIALVDDLTLEDLFLEGLIDSSSDGAYHPLPNCVVAHTIRAVGKFNANQTRFYAVKGPATNLSAQGGAAGGCGVAADATAVALNVKVQGAAGNGQAFVFAPGTVTSPSVVNFSTSHPPFNNEVVVPLDTGFLAPAEFGVKLSQAAHVIVHVVGYFSPLGGASPLAPETEELSGSEAGRPLLVELLSPGELERFLSGEDPATIELADGTTLEGMLADGLIDGTTENAYFPLDNCVVLHTIRAGVKFAANETRPFAVRGATTDLSPQGGAPGGCGVSSEARAVVLNFKVQGAAGNGQVMVAAPGSTLPPAILNFAPGHSPFNNQVIVPLEAGLFRGLESGVGLPVEFSVRLTEAAHLVGHVVGYFAPAAP